MHWRPASTPYGNTNKMLCNTSTLAKCRSTVVVVQVKVRMKTDNDDDDDDDDDDDHG